MRSAVWLFFGCVLALSTAKLAAQQAGSGRARHYPPIKLRSYGTLSGEAQGDEKTSSLTITADNAAKATLVLAKYLSDLVELPGVTPLSIPTAGGPVSAHLIATQGALVAMRYGNCVVILTAPDPTLLRQLIEARIPAGTAIDSSTAEVEVPMYLDRWDKYSFRFYYAPLTKPRDAQGRDVPGNYDPRPDFKFADQSGKSGLVIWNSPFSAPSADGIFDLTSREWAHQAAQAHGLPLGINVGITDGNIVLTNRYAGAVAPLADGYLGGWYYESPSGIPTLSYASSEAQEAGLSQLKTLVSQLNAKHDNIVNWLEPHEEMGHGIADLLDDHGADARKSFNQFLDQKYGGLAAVSRRYGTPYKSWDDVPFPELATFFGYAGDAIDLTGVWKMSTTAAYDASSAAPDLDDSSWPGEPVPGHAIMRYMPRKPTVLRRHVNVDAAWRARHPRSWLYCWDLENTSDMPVNIYVNGTLCPENPPMRRGWHFSRVEVSASLKDGDNLITLELPTGWIDYRTYLTGEPPATYPALATPELNARYADWSDWCSWSRGQALRRGMQMIRQVDPDKPITLMASGAWWNDFKQSAEDYGGILHDTGGMAGFWNDVCPALAQSTGLPTDCEPGGPALDLDDFKRFMGRWSTENTQGVDYFMHLGDVLWRPEIKAYFEKTQPLWHLMGKYHLPQPEIADLTSLRAERLFGFPMNLGDHGSSVPDLVATGPGVFASGLDSTLASVYSRGSVIESDFANGDADQYKVIIDTNSSILDPGAIDAISRWVQRGGTFITFQQTGRHTSTQHDVWPISKLTGYDVTAVERKGRNLKLALGQTVLPEDGLAALPNNWGLTLKKYAADDSSCQDIALWEDGTVAAGGRKLGKGTVIDFGMFDSLPLITKALDKMGIKHVPGHVTDRKVIMRHFVSNNGLYDVWTMWNEDKVARSSDLFIDSGRSPASAIDVNTGEEIPVSQDASGFKIAALAFEPWQTRVLLTPRGDLSHAAGEWFWLQRGWWRGTADPGKPMATYKPQIALDLTDDNAMRILPGDGQTMPPADPALSDPGTDDSAWPKASLGIFDIPDHADAHHVVFCKHFVVPASWDHGQVSVFGKSEPPGNGSIRRYMDGKPFGGQIVRDDLVGILKPRSRHVLTTEIWGAAPPLGTVTPAWISYLPDPGESLMLKSWNFAPDYLTYAKAAVALPYQLPDRGALRCVVDIDPKLAGKTVMLHVVTSDAGLGALLVNGHHYAGYGNIYNFIDANITPVIHFGHPNEFIVVVGGKTILQQARVGFYNKGEYP
jgi:hypothetical protein